MEKKLNNINPQTVLLIIGLIFGLSFVILNPPFNGNDESVHFYKASDISEGHIMPTIKGNRAGVVIPHGIEFIAYEFSYKDPNQKLDMSNITSKLCKYWNFKKRSFIDISNTAIINYPPIPYLASSIGIIIGKLLNLPPLILLYIGRLFSLLLWIYLVYLAIKITPVHKWVFLMLVLMPMSLFQAATISADTITMGLSFLTIAIFLNFAFDKGKEKINIKDICILAPLLIILVLTKPFYFLIMFLFFIIPVKKFGSRKKLLLIFSLISLSVIMITLIWYSAVSGLYVPENPDASIKGQLAFISADPANYIYILLNTIYEYTSGYMIGFVGQLGWFVRLPLWFVFTYLTLVFIISLFDKNNVKINFKQKLNAFIVFFIISMFIFFTLYIAWTAVGSNVIDGVQGRYLIPIIPLFFLLFYDVGKPIFQDKRIYLKIGENKGFLIIIFSIFSLLFSLFTLMKGIYI
jgi:uncharacterized membrane protein